MPLLDIREYKKDLRNRIKTERREMEPELKKKVDSAIARNVRRLYQYKSCETVLVYVSTEIEVDTKEIIMNAWEDGKKVAVPRCIPNTRLMEFHYITSFEQLSPGLFSVLEPSEDLPIVTKYDACLMLVPALMFDRSGYRLGYGKGYYDRYMSKFTGTSVGLAYSFEVKYKMIHGRFDRPVDLIVTDKWIKKSIVQQSRFKKR